MRWLAKAEPDLSDVAGCFLRCLVRFSNAEVDHYIRQKNFVKFSGGISARILSYVS